MNTTSNTGLPAIERMSSMVIRILGMNPSAMTHQGTNTYLIGRTASRILVDAGQGEPSYLTNLKQVLSEEKCTIDTLLISHWHDDHTGGIPDLLTLNPKLKVYKCASDVDAAFQKLHQFHYTPLHDAQSFTQDDTTIQAIKSPGHSDDHFTFYLHGEQAYFSADCLLGGTSTVIENMSHYITSLRVALTFPMQRIYTGHGFHYEGVQECKEALEKQIEHRLQRERQIVEALTKADNLTVDDLALVVYPQLTDAMLIWAAKNNLRVQLQKLQDDEVVLHSGAYYSLIK